VIEPSQLKIRMPSAHGLVVIDPPQSGERNMEIDEALLQNAQPDGPIVLRIYRWEQPTLSLGHFQKPEDRYAIPGLGELPWVRRKTGGGAILHEHELTYSLIVPDNRRLRSTGDSNGSELIDHRPAPSKGHSEKLYRAVHLALVRNLQGLGWNAQLSETCTCQTSKDKKPEPFLCFLRRSPVDIVIGQHKILGSAQRRTATGLLQHGSLLIRNSRLTPELFGLLNEACDPGRVKSEQSEKLVQQFWVNQGSVAELDVSQDGGKPTFDEIELWTGWMVASLKAGISEVLEVNWEQD